MVGVEEVKIHATYVHLPNLCIDDTSGIRNFYYSVLSVLLKNWLNRELVKVLRLIVSKLLTIN